MLQSMGTQRVGHDQETELKGEGNEWRAWVSTLKSKCFSQALLSIFGWLFLCVPHYFQQQTKMYT